MIKRYSSRRESISDSLLNKRLKNAKSYDRIAGYFSSSIFEVAGESIESIQGEVRIICNSELNIEDIETAKTAKEALRREWNQQELEKLNFDSEKLKKLHEYLSTGKLKVRVLPDKKFGLVHGKAGVITLSDGSKTSFLGSVNESKTGWNTNYELVWEDDSQEAVEWVQEEFDVLWNDSSAIDLPDVIIKDIKRISNRKLYNEIEDIKEDEEFPASVSIETPIYKEKSGLWEHQKYFIQKAFRDHKTEHGARYVLADPVGLGKTLQLALSAELMALYGDKPILIIVPRSLMRQWQDELKELLHLPSARWDGTDWIDENEIKHPNKDRTGILNCPRKVGIVSQGLITAQSEAASYLLSKNYECIIVDEVHHARRKKINDNNYYDFSGTNLYDFLLKISPKTKSLLLATATPIQLHPIELWDLLNILAQGSNKVLGTENSLWRSKGKIAKGLDLIKNKYNDLTETEQWRWIKNPFPPSYEDDIFDILRSYSNVKDNKVVFPKQYHQLDSTERSYVEHIMYNFFEMYNPFIRHVVRRKREYLEQKKDQYGEPLLEKIEVEIIEEDPLLLTGYMKDAYEYAEQFCKTLATRVRGAGFFRTFLLKRIGSSIEAGRSTGIKLQQNWGNNLDLSAEDEEYSEIKDLTPKEQEHLDRFVNALNSNKAEDPKYNKLVQLLKRDKWIEQGVIIFSQYYDTVEWVANKLSKEFNDIKIGIYAGNNKAGYFLNEKFYRKSKDEIKKMVMNYELKILLGTDSAAEGLNLQALRRLVNIDIPWNPTRLEQRKGRIQRGGQRFNKIFLYNMRYKDSVEDRVHELLSDRLKTITKVFGQLPDVLEDAWINVAIDKKEEAKKVINKVPEQHPYDIKYDQEVETSDWETCYKVLAEEAKLDKLKKSW